MRFILFYLSKMCNTSVDDGDDINDIQFQFPLLLNELHKYMIAVQLYVKTPLL